MNKARMDLITPEQAAKLSDDDLTSRVLFYRDIILTSQEFMFCEFVSVGTPAIRSAENAGYKTAAVPRANPQVRQCCALMREQASRQANVSTDWRKIKLQEIIDKAMAQDPPQLSAATSAIRELNSMDHDEKVELTIAAGLNQMMQGLNVDVHNDLELLGKIFHSINLSEDDYSVVDQADPARISET